jgi:hypothetical protein
LRQDQVFFLERCFYFLEPERQHGLLAPRSQQRDGVKTDTEPILSSYSVPSSTHNE